MLNWMLAHVEYIALVLNISMTLAFLWQQDLAKVLYWLGSALVVLGVISMRQ